MPLFATSKRAHRVSPPSGSSHFLKTIASPSRSLYPFLTTHHSLDHRHFNYPSGLHPLLIQRLAPPSTHYSNSTRPPPTTFIPSSPEFHLYLVLSPPSLPTLYTPSTLTVYHNRPNTMALEHDLNDFYEDITDFAYNASYVVDSMFLDEVEAQSVPTTGDNIAETQPDTAGTPEEEKGESMLLDVSCFPWPLSTLLSARRCRRPSSMLRATALVRLLRPQLSTGLLLRKRLGLRLSQTTTPLSLVGGTCFASGKRRSHPPRTMSGRRSVRKSKTLRGPRARRPK